MRERNVIGYLDPDGTATVTGSGLPVEQAAAACARVEELARAAKRAGHRARIGVLRTDIYLGLLDGRWQHHTRDQIITDLLNHATSDSDADPDHSTEPDPTNVAPVSQGPPEGQTQARETDEPETEDAPSAAPLARRVGVEVRVGLSTPLGHDQHPGDVPGWGPVPAEVARTMVAAHRGAQWRYAITDATGGLVLAGITRRRPHHPAPAVGELPPCRGGIVELQVPATLLNELATDPETGGLPLAALTAWQALIGIARISAGQRILIHRAAGGVGHLAIQVAKTRKAHVIGTASAAKHDFLRSLGADELIDYTVADFVHEAGAVDVVLDLLGGADAHRSAAVLKPGGLIVGAIGGNLGLTPQRATELGVRFEVVSVRPSVHDLAQLTLLVESGRLTVHVDQTFPLAEVAKAHEFSASGHTTGKVVLVP